MSQAILDEFIARCRVINPSFRTDKGGGLLKKKSSLYGLLEFLAEQIKSHKIVAFKDPGDALSHCENQRDSRIAKYRSAIGFLVDNWANDAPDASDALLFLRKNPLAATSKVGFKVHNLDGNIGAMGGKCSISCKGRAPMFFLDIASGGYDWYIPYADKEAKSVLVPFGQPDETLVVTWPMNGCALEVRQEAYGNRFFHDADGKNMPNVTNKKTIKFRADYTRYSGPKDPKGPKDPVREERIRMGETQDVDQLYPEDFHFDLIAVKKGSFWHIFQTASISIKTMSFITDKTHVYRNKVFKVEIEHSLGSFADKVKV